MANISYSIAQDAVQIAVSVAVIIMLGARIVFELVSVVENLAVVSDTRESEALKWISGILMKLVGIGRKKIEQKIDKYSLYQDESNELP